MCKFESSRKDESRWQSTDSLKAYRNTSAFKYLEQRRTLNDILLRAAHGIAYFDLSKLNLVKSMY